MLLKAKLEISIHIRS